MRVLLPIAIVLIVVLLFAADRAIKAIRRGLRRREANERLAAAAAEAEARVNKRRAAEKAREALTSVMPTIHEHDPRHVEEPSLADAPKPERAPELVREPGSAEAPDLVDEPALVSEPGLAGESKPVHDDPGRADAPGLVNESELTGEPGLTDADRAG